MRFLSESKAIERLDAIISDLKGVISEKYEHRAKSCHTCETQGACCLDAHFVNVHISRLEAIAIERSFRHLSPERQNQISARVGETIQKYSLSAEGDTFTQTFACPLFEKGIGCLVHESGKPVPCIMHACYEFEEDLPPDDLQTSAENKIAELNNRTYSIMQPPLPIPLALRNYAKVSVSE